MAYWTHNYAQAMKLYETHLEDTILLTCCLQERCEWNFTINFIGTQWYLMKMINWLYIMKLLSKLLYKATVCHLCTLSQPLQCLIMSHSIIMTKAKAMPGYL